MSMGALRRAMLTTILALSAFGASAAPVQAAASDPLFVFVPILVPCPPVGGKLCEPPFAPPPVGDLNGPCGLGVDSTGNFYVSDYYRDNVNVFLPDGYGPPPQNARPFYLTQISDVGPISGPCGLALDAADNVYVNVYHRSVVKFGSKASFGTGTPIAGAGVDSTHPTGVAVDPVTGTVYVDARTHIAVYDSSGAPVMDGEEPLRIGAGTLGDGFGIAFSQFPGTAGRLYVADAATNTVKVYDPAVDQDQPVAEIDGAATPNGKFVSLRDSALAVDRVSGELYVVDNLEPAFAEQPDGIVYVFGADGSYKGHLKHLIGDALPPGLAVDNGPSATHPIGTQGRVYVTSGNTAGAAVYAYPPGAATTAAPKPSIYALDEPATVAAGSAPVGGPEAPAPANLPAAASAGPTLAQGETQQVGNMLLSVSARLSPNELPRDGLAPTGVSVGWKIGSTDGTEPPKLKTIEIEINRNGILDATGLPVCPYGKIQPASTSRALSNCRASLVGKGTFSALVGLEGQERYAAKGTMLVFNGRKKGKPVLYGQLYSAYPFANSFVIVFQVEKSRKGAFGTLLTGKLPGSLLAWGNLTEAEMSLARKYRHQGKSRSFISASCPTPKGVGLAVFKLAKTNFSFTSGTKASTTLTETCKVKR